MKKPIITEEEKQKIKEMDSIRKKIGYIWDYYKLWIIGAVVLVGLVVYFTVVFATREDKPILDVVLVNNYDDVSEDCRLTQGFVSYAQRKTQKVLSYYGCRKSQDRRVQGRVEGTGIHIQIYCEGGSQR